MKIWGIVVVLASWTALAQGGPLDLRQVPTDARWVAHVDVDTMRGPEVFARAFEAVAERWSDVGERIERLHGDFGLNLATGLHSITLYGSQFGKPAGVLLANVDVDRGMLEAKMKEAPGYKTEKHGLHTLHSWADDHGPLAGVFYTPTILVFGRTTAEVTAALDVLDGKSPNLAKKDSPLAAKVPAGATFVGRADGLADADLPWKSPLLKQSESIAIAWGVNGDELFGEARLVAKSAEAAPLFRDVVNGAQATASLQFGSDPDIKKLLEAVKIHVDGRTVSAQWRTPIADVWARAEGIFERWEQAGP